MSKVALITGAATGMGNAIATSLSQQGYKVIILDWNVTEGQKLASEINGDFFKVDVTSWSQQFHAFESTFTKYGRIDLVHANAGIGDRVDYYLPESTEKFNADEPPKLSTLEVDLVGVIYSSLLATRYFRKNDSAEVKKPMLLFTSSGIGIYPGSAAPMYSAAKHGVVGLARSLAARWREEGVDWRCNALAPGFVPTAIVPKAMRDRCNAEGVTTSVEQIVDAVNDMLCREDLSGAICEVSRDKRWYRDPPPFLDKVQQKVLEDIFSFKGTVLEFERARQTGQQPVS